MTDIKIEFDMVIKNSNDVILDKISNIAYSSNPPSVEYILSLQKKIDEAFKKVSRT